MLPLAAAIRYYIHFTCTLLRCILSSAIAMKNFSRKIKDLRRHLDLSQEKLARRLNITKKTVAEWEQGRQPPSPERALQMARLVGPGRLRRWFIQLALERIGADPPLVLDALLDLPNTRRGTASPRSAQGPLRVADLRIVTPTAWSERLRALEGLDVGRSGTISSLPLTTVFTLCAARYEQIAMNNRLMDQR